MIALPPRAPFLLLALLLLGASGLQAPVAVAGDEPAPTDERIFPLSAVRPGLRGTAHTVFSGTRVETFEVEVVDVVHNFLSKQDVILVRCLGDRIGRTGIAEGMSGSPVTIDGKIVGALSYAWEWTKEPICGVTPIESMIADGSRLLEGRPSGSEPPTLLRQPRPRPIRARDGDLRRIATPLCLGGFSPAGCARVADALADVGLPVRIGGGVVTGAPAGWANLDAPVVPGCALTVDLVRGDFSASAVGTCTFVDGDRVFAFGHGFQDIGETLFPLSVAYIYSVVPKHNLSFKMGASIREVGAIVQDRQSGVTGMLGAKAPMVPVHVRLGNEATGRVEDFHFEVTANRTLFRPMLILSIREAFSKAERTLGANTKHFDLEVKLAGVGETWSYQDTIVAFDAGFSRVLVTIVDRVMNHPTQRAEFERIDLDVRIENVDRRATVEKVTASKDEVRPGEEVELLVRMRRMDGGELFFERFTVRIPADAPTGDFGLLVTGGDDVAAEVATPIDVLDIPALYDAFYKSTELVVIVPTGRIDLDMDGRLLRNLPLSVVARLARSPGAARVKIQPVSEKLRRTVPYVVSGKGKVVLRVVR